MSEADRIARALRTPGGHLEIGRLHTALRQLQTERLRLRRDQDRSNRGRTASDR